MRASAHMRGAVVTLACGLLSLPCRSQEPTGKGGPELHVAFAGSAHRGRLPALVWLCEQYLPQLPAWPDGLDPRAPFSLTLSTGGLSIGPTTVKVPEGAVAVGSLTLATVARTGDALLWQCDVSGIENWYVPAAFELPERWRRLLHAIEADVFDTPRMLAVPVAAGHLAGGLLDGDPRAEALRLGAALCGETTWSAWRTDGEVRVRGRGDGGLMLPLALLGLAVVDGGGGPSALALRAFAARDADRAEAARQLGRDDRPADVATLRALLMAEDAVRLTAIDSLVRHGRSEELPQIVAAAGPQTPWATIAASDALRTLWAGASPLTRQETRAALHKSRSIALRGIVLEDLAARAGDRSANDMTPGATARLSLLLFLSAVGLLGLWARERVRAQPRR